MLCEKYGTNLRSPKSSIKILELRNNKISDEGAEIIGREILKPRFNN